MTTSRLLLIAALLAAPSCTPSTAKPVVTPAAPPAAAQASPVPAAAGSRTAWLQAFARGYFPGRSGQLFVVPREGEFVVDRNDKLYSFMHGSPWSYDTHIPLLLYGPPFIKATTSSTPVAQQDVVPTLAALLGTAPPATAVGRPLREALATASGHPRVIALFVLDGTRADYFETYKDAIPTLSKLRAAGAWFSNANVTSVPTLTAVGHANLGTGAEPRTHGLAVNNLFNRVTNAPQEAYDKLNPGEMMALTLADVWNIQTDGKAVIIGQGGAIRAAAGLVGHGACILNGRPMTVASYNASTGGWETNKDCYTMPASLAPLNAKAYWEKVNGSWMGHDIADTKRFRHSAVFQTFEGDALAAVLEGAPIGADDVTDLVLVNMKGTDYVGHAYGPASPEIKAELVELDTQIARVVDIIEKKAGAGRFVLAFAADHGMPGEPKPGGRLFLDDIARKVDDRFARGGTVVQYYKDAANNELHLDTAKLAAAGVSLKDVATYLETEKVFAAVFTEDEVRAAQAGLR